MKKFMYFGIAAIALSMAACSSDDEVAQQPEQMGVVKTSFNISVPGSPKTRMSDNRVQYHAVGQDPTFLGIDSIELIPFGKAGEIASTDVRLGANLVLGQLGATPAINKNNSINALNDNGTNSQYYRDVEVPIGTRSFLFYGRAPQKAATADATIDQINGCIFKKSATLSDQTPADIEFQLRNIYTATSTPTLATTLCNYLTSIANATNTVDGVEYKWSDTANMYNGMYNAFITMKAGASANVQALVQRLYNELKDVENSTATGIKNAITNSTYVSAVSTDGVLTFKDAVGGDLTTKANCYPASLNLPDGAAIIAWNDTDKAFEVSTTPTNLGLSVAALNDYTYPASLYYRGNSQISVDNENTHAADYTAATTTSWDAMNGSTYDDNSLLGKYQYHQGTVAINTKSIAIEEQIQYAVGRLDLQVGATTANLPYNTTEWDANANGGAGAYVNKTVAVGTEAFQVTGILVGGQKAVDFEFHPIANATAKTIYDNQIATETTDGYASATKYLSTTMADAMRTLVLECDDDEVNFAIEFKNNSGVDFVGRDGIVANGCKFYLIGKIKKNPGEGEGTVTKPKDANNNDIDIAKIFLQDYYTTVKASVSSLVNAYNVIPDLRAPKLELGLSVDLTWQQANTYEVPLQ